MAKASPYAGIGREGNGTAVALGTQNGQIVLNTFEMLRVGKQHGPCYSLDCVLQYLHAKTLTLMELCV